MTPGTAKAIMLVKIAVILLSLPGILAQVPYIQNGPSPTRGVSEYDVTMYCQIGDKTDSDLYWHCISANGQQYVTVGPDFNTNPALSKYVIDNSGASVGQYNLIIANVSFLDRGRCICIVVDDIGNVFEESATLEVLDTATPPSEPTCSIDKSQTPGQSRRIFTAEDDVELVCESRDGVPKADLHWEVVRDGSDGKGVEIVSSFSTTENSIAAIANYKIAAADDGAYFQCVQTHASLQNNFGTCDPVYTSVNGREPLGRIMVKYRPILTFSPPTITVNSEGTTHVSLKCESTANPELDSGPIIRQGAIGDARINLNYTFEGRQDSAELILDQDDIGKVIICDAPNELGHSVIEIEIEMANEFDILVPIWMIVVITGGIGLVLFLICAVYLCCTLKKYDDLKPRRVTADPFRRDDNRVRENDPRVYDYPPDSYVDDVSRNRPGTYAASELGVENEYQERGEYTYGNYDADEHEMVDINNMGFFDEKGAGIPVDFNETDFETGDEYD